MVKIKAVIFDMDGVLVDARDWHYQALNKALKLFGADISYDDHIKTFDGLPTAHKLEILSEKRGVPRGLHKFINTMKQKYTMQIINEKAAPTFEHEYALSHLNKDGYKMCVASNSILDTINALMDKCDLAQYLEFVLSNQDVKQGKPSPEIYNKAISKLGLTPAECIIVEDNPNGVQAAKASQAFVLVVSDPTEVTYDNIIQFIKQVERGEYIHG